MNQLSQSQWRYRELIEAVLDSLNPEEALFLYERYYDDLKNVTFYFFEGIEQFPEDLYIECQAHNITPPFFGNKFTFINSSFIEGETEFNLEIDVNIDLQIVGALRKLLLRNNCLHVEKEMHTLRYLENVRSTNMPFFHCSCFPYLIENAFKNQFDDEALWETLFAFQLYDRYGVDYLIDNNKSIEVLKEHHPELKMRADTSFRYLQSFRNDPQYSMFYVSFFNSYILLLHTTLQRFSGKLLSIQVENLIIRCLSDLGTVSKREVPICVMFLKNHKIPFFNPIQYNNQINSDKFLDKLKRMAWDITHLRNCVEFMNQIAFNKLDSIYLHFFSSIDKGLDDFARRIKIKSLALFDGGPLLRIESEAEVLKHYGDIYGLAEKIPIEQLQGVRKNAQSLHYLKCRASDLENELKRLFAR